MKYLILCGGRGERFISAHPKPLNRICGKMVGEWMVKSLLKFKITELIWILNPKLYIYNIENEIIRWTGPNITNIFIKLPFETRDPSETLDIALQQLDFNEPFICLDNDNIYVDGIDNFIFDNEPEAAILVSPMKSDIIYTPKYGFVKIHDNIILEGREKMIGWGENAYSCGGYWFRSPNICRQWLSIQKNTYKSQSERSLLTLIISNSRHTVSVITNESFSIGTPEDCADAEHTKTQYFGWKGSRIVVDLDNTLVTYPRCSGDYNTVEPLYNVVDWVRDKSNKGAEIIVSTGRRMGTHNGNPGKVLSDVGLTTLSTIKNLSINDTEINMGKPIGDIYIDDRSVNPYDRNWTLSSGDWSDVSSQLPINSLPVTRNVSVSIKHVEHVLKTGSKSELQGQASYYIFINNGTGRSIQDLFPRCYDCTITDTVIDLDLEYIKGVPASYLWCHNVFSKREWDICVGSLEKIHSLPLVPDITFHDVIDGYLAKVETRRKTYDIYNKVDNDGVMWTSLKNRLKDYHPQKITHIHGDSFMGNILFPMKGGIKFIDMKGELNGKITTQGDPNYDWAKLATSFLGMDSIVYNLPIRSIHDGLEWIQMMHDPDIIISLALVLMYGAIWVYQEHVSHAIISRISNILNFIT